MTRTKHMCLLNPVVQKICKIALALCFTTTIFPSLGAQASGPGLIASRVKEDSRQSSGYRKPVKASQGNKAVTGSKKKSGKKSATVNQTKLRQQQGVQHRRRRKQAPVVATLRTKGLQGISSVADQPELVDLDYDSNGRMVLKTLPRVLSLTSGKAYGVSRNDEQVFYTIDGKLQRFVDDLIRRAYGPHIAIVVMDPNRGSILALADRSSSVAHLSLHAGFPAASIFKLVTATAAIERAQLSPNSMIQFRGGTYELERWNYLPDDARDRRIMSISEALGRSCNAVFGRIALGHLSSKILKQYSSLFGFNESLHFDAPLEPSDASIPSFDDYALSRTGAGFGEVHLSPIHAAALVSGIANGGSLPRPMLIDHVVNKKGSTIYRSKPETLTRIMDSHTSTSLLNMMQYTTTVGTSRREFFTNGRPVLPGIPVAAKTGTLKGGNPQGLNHWFVAAAPLYNPEIAISVIVVSDGGHITKASQLGRHILEYYFKNRNT